MGLFFLLSTRHSRKSDFPATRKRSVTRCQPPNHSRTSRSSKDVGRRRAHQRRGGPGRRRGRSRSRRRRWRQVRLHVRLDALKGVLKIALIHDGLARGLREASKALDRRQAHMCVLNEACEEEAYKKLVIALCSEHKIPLIK